MKILDSIIYAARSSFRRNAASATRRLDKNNFASLELTVKRENLPPCISTFVLSSPLDSRRQNLRPCWCKKSASEPI